MAGSWLTYCRVNDPVTTGGSTAGGVKGGGSGVTGGDSGISDTVPIVRPLLETYMGSQLESRVGC